jgi:ATP-dependent RNA helicase RhlE
VPSGLLVTARRGRSAGERKSENGEKRRFSTTVRENRAATPVETTSDGRGRRRPTRRRDRRRSGPVGRKVRFEKRREKVENRTIRGQHSEPSADRSPSTESDETRRSDGATRRPPGRKISSRSEERFGRRGRRRGTTRRARRQKDQSTRAARRRTRRRRGTDARNSRQHGERRVGGTEQKKIAKIGEGVRKLSTIRRASKCGFVRRRPHAGYDGHAQRHRTPGGRRGRRRRLWRSGQNVGPRSRRCQVRFRGRTFLFFFAVEVCDESEISQTYRQSLAAAAVRPFEYSA